MSDSSLVVLAIPAVGALIIAIAALRPRPATADEDRSLSVETPGGAIDHDASEAAPFRRIAIVFSVCALAAVAGLSLFDRWLRLNVTVGGNDLSSSFALLTAAAWLPVLSAARRSERKRPALLYGLLLFLEASYLAIFACDHAIWLCAALEVNSVLLYLLVTGWGGSAVEGTAKKMLLMNLAADLAILIGLLGVVIASARVAGSEHNANVRLTYSLSEIVRELPRLTTEDVVAQEYWKHAQRSLLTILILAAAIKAPLVPFHAWFAAVVADGPLCVGLALVGPGLRVGLFLLARFVGPICGDLGMVADMIVGLTVLGAVHAGLLAYGQSDLKRLLASVCLLQGSLAVAGFFATRPGVASGPLLLSMANGVAAVLILYSLGFLETRFGIQDLNNVGGIVQKLPNLAGVLVIAVFSLLGIPGLFGFPGLFTTLGSLFGVEVTLGFLAIGAGLIGCWALYSLLQRLVLGSLRLPLPGEGNVLIDRGDASAPAGGPHDSPQDLSMPAPATPLAWSIVDDGRSGSIDLGWKELLILAPLLLSVIACGIWPQAISAALHAAPIVSPCRTSVPDCCPKWLC